MCTRVISGPWPGSGSSSGGDEPPVQVQRTPRAPIPHRIPVDRHGSRGLTSCRACLAPFDPRLPVPRDLYCATCRPADDQLALFDVIDHDTESDRHGPRRRP